ncbi:MAG: SUMF1/EgtB/PvdO family nonheme iron enzyme [Hyphomicrobiaceae bacterium]
MLQVVSLLVVLIAVAIASPANAKQRIALLIGNQNYAAAVGPLQNPHNDVDLIGAALHKLRFDVRILKDATYGQIDIAIKQHAGRLRRAGTAAIGFFYYSGHGIANPDTRANYLVPIDVTDAEGEDFWYAAFEQNLIIDRLRKRAGNATHYVVFDACRNELRISGSAAKGIGDQKGFVPVTDTSGILIAYATAPSQTASDAGYGGGPYAKALAAEIIKPGVEAVTMFRKVQLRVKRSIGQDPWLSIPTLPEIYLAGRKTPTTDQPRRPVRPVSLRPTRQSAQRLIRPCLHQRRHRRAGGFLEHFKDRLMHRAHEFGWQLEKDRGTLTDILDPRLAWHGISRVAIVDDVLEIDYAWRGGTLRLVPVTSHRRRARTTAKSGGRVITMQGLWMTDNSHGCIEVRFDHKGVAHGELGARASNQKDTLVFLRPAGPDRVQRRLPQLVAAVKRPSQLDLSRNDCKNLPLDQAVKCNLLLGAALRKQFLSSAQPSQFNRCDGIEVRVADTPRRCLKPGHGQTFQDCANCPEMVVVPPGSFIMGSSNGDIDERPRHKVVITQPFAAAKYEVTRDQWYMCVNENGCRARTDMPRATDENSRQSGSHPAVHITWHQAKSFAAWLSRKTGQVYRLLSEAEWEYIARAGTTTRYGWGNSIGRGRANCRGCGSPWDNRTTAKVGSFPGTPWGIHDLHGNVWEWVEDAWYPSYTGLTQVSSTSHPAALNVMRGGAWNTSPHILRSAARGRAAPATRRKAIGFRIARTLKPS